MALLDAANFAVGGASITIGTNLGYIKSPDGIKFTPSVELYLAGDVEQLTTPAAAFTTDEGFEISFTLCELDQANVVIALGTDNAWTDVPPDVLKFGDGQTGTVSRVIAATGIEPGTAFVRTLNLFKTVLSGMPEIVFSKTTRQEAALTFTALYDDTTNDAVGNFSDAGA